MTKPRIAFIVTGLGTGGAEHMLLKLLQSAHRASLQSMVVSLRDEGALGSSIRETGAELVCCHLHSLMGSAQIFRAFRAVRDFKPTLLQGWMYHGNLVAYLFGRFLRDHVPVYWSIRQTLYSVQEETLLLRAIIRLLCSFSSSISGVIYNSLAAMVHHQRAGMTSKQDVMIPNGIDLARFRKDDNKRQALRANLGIPKDTPVVGLVARVHPMKDHHTFSRAARLLSDRIPDVNFVLAGTGTNSDSMRSLLAEAGIAEKTIRLGPVRQTEDIYPALDVLVLSSAWGEGWPNVIGEAMACEVPCIATSIGEVQQIIGDTGLVVSPQDPPALAWACEAILRLNPQQRQKLGAAARQRIAANFDISTIFDRHLQIWTQGSPLQTEKA